MPAPLIDVTELEALGGEPALRIADTRWYLGEPERGRAAYAAGHIPGAVYVDLDHHLSAVAGPGRHPLPDPAVFARRMAQLGIGAEHLVVAYDDRGGAIASRLWWMLRAQGHDAIRVLDGGWTAWEDSGRPTATGLPAPVPTLPAIDARPWPGTVNRHEVRAGIGAITLIDARSGERYRGEIEPIDPVAGHIPTSVNLHYDANLGPDLRFLPAAELRARFAAAAEGPVVSYCGSGVTACHNLLAMELAGITGGLLYPGSWSDWATAGEEVATGPNP